MSTKKQQKAKRLAKQQAMERSREDADALDSETEGLDQVLSELSDDDGTVTTKDAVNFALEDVKAGAEMDPRLVALFKDFKRYRVIVVAIVVVAFAILGISMTLYNNGTIDEDTQNVMLIYASIVMLVDMAIIFGRVRPIREDINAWNKVNNIALKESGGKHGATEADIDRILAHRARNRRIPPTPEFKRIRRVWLALVVAGAVLMVVAIVLANMNPGNVTPSVVVIVFSWGLLMVAMIIERSKMKPLREAWAAEMDAKMEKEHSKKARR